MDPSENNLIVFKQLDGYIKYPYIVLDEHGHCPPFYYIGGRYEELKALDRYGDLHVCSICLAKDFDKTLIAVKLNLGGYFGK